MRYEVVNPIPKDIYIQARDWSGFTLYHTQAWHQVLERTFGWRVQALLALEDDEIIAYLPFVRKRRLTKKKNIALPISHRIGFAYKRSNFATTIETIPLTSLEIHEVISFKDVQTSHDNDITVLDLSRFDDEEMLFNSLDKSSVRYMIRRAEKNNVEVRCSTDSDAVDILYSLVVETRHRQGSPVYPRDFFPAICDAFGDEFKVYIAHYEGHAVAASAFFNFGDTVIYGYSASTNDPEVKRLGANELVMWQALRDALRTRKLLMDFGTSPVSNPGLRHYKEKWGGVSLPLHYTYYPSGGGIKRDSSSVKRVNSALQKMPRSLFQQISPTILRVVI